MPFNISKTQFVSAYVTDTRLMGVVGLYIHWAVTGADDMKNDLHQFFYFETEEFGFEEYTSLKGNDVYELTRLEQSLFAGLGGKKVDLTEREAVYLLQTFAEFNKEHNIPLPQESISEYSFLLDRDPGLSPKERAAVMNKMCTRIENEYQAIHYFLMRVFGRDFAGAAHLIKGNILLNIYLNLPISTMCMNTVDEQYAEADIDEVGEFTYMAESVLDCGDCYYLVISELEVDEDLKITKFSARTSFRISPMEAAMKLRRPEFTTIYSMAVHPSRFETECTAITDRALSTEHENGKLYMMLHPHNDHVKLPVFRLSNDVKGMYYVSNYGQILAIAYTLEDIYLMERDLRRSPIGGALKTLAKYEFKEPLIYEFINSDFEDFNDFLDLVRDDSYDDE